MKLEELQKDTEYTIRLGRYKDGLDHPDWGPWKARKLFVHRNKKGQVVLITPDAGPWAEYTPDCYSATYNVFEAEGYYMEVKELASK